MPNRQTKSKHLLITLSSIVLVSLLLVTINIRHDKSSLFLESVVVWFFSPVQSLLTNTVETVSETLNYYFFLVGVSRENERLLLEIDRLSQEKNELLEKNKYLERIEKLVGNIGKNQRTIITAKIIGRDATQWSKMVFIDKGTNHQVKENLVVMTDAGIVGHVIHVSTKTSKVLLITDSRSAVDSLFQETRGTGVTVGTGQDACKMKFVPIEANVSIGDRIVSSGLGGIFPKGLMVGVVVDVVKKRQDLFQNITVAPSADLSQMEEVAVVLAERDSS